MRRPQLGKVTDTMTGPRFLGVLALTVLGTLACSPTNGKETAQPAEDPDGSIPDPEEAGLITLEEAEAEAAEVITPENADRELERLASEVGGG